MRKNNPIEKMLEEHDRISECGKIIHKIEKLWESDVDRYENILTGLVIFFREYADTYHHRKEEDVLFPAIKNHPDFILSELVDEFEEHHESFRNYLSEITNALNDRDYERSYLELRNYLEDLLDHIGAENDELFIIAETLLNDEELEMIFFRFQDIDMEVGEIRKKELEEDIITLADSI